MPKKKLSVDELVEEAAAVVSDELARTDLNHKERVELLRIVAYFRGTAYQAKGGGKPSGKGAGILKQVRSA